MNLLWVDLESPTKEEIHDVMNDYGIHPRIVERLITPSADTDFDIDGDTLYLIMHFPAAKHSRKNFDTYDQEVDFIIKNNVLITTHYEPIDALHKFAKDLEVYEITGQKSMGDHGAYLLYHLVKELYKAVGHELQFVHSDLTWIEKEVFAGKEKEMVKRISETGRELLNFNQILYGHATVWKSFGQATERLVNKEFGHNIEVLLDQYEYLHHSVQQHHDVLNEMRQTNDAMLSAKQNEVMRILTIVAFLTLPLSLLAGIFGMNASNIPIIGSPNDFWIIVGIMFVFAVSFFAFFRFKKWL